VHAIEVVEKRRNAIDFHVVNRTELQGR
jgi:hypothetical protein